MDTLNDLQLDIETSGTAAVEAVVPWYYEDCASEQGYIHVAGLDEAGRGPLAGPVVAAAVILPRDFDIEGVGDSKRLTAKARDVMFEKISCGALAIGVGIVDSEKIDEINILRATHLAMRIAVENLAMEADYILLDGLPVLDLPCPSLAIVKGDYKCVSIGAASIIAKVTRDRMMIEFDAVYPEYGFAVHKGYGTRDHVEAIRKHGPCPCHRRSFAPISEVIQNCRLPGLD